MRSVLVDVKNGNWRFVDDSMNRTGMLDRKCKWILNAAIPIAVVCVNRLQ